MRGDRLGFYQAELYLWAKFNLGMAHALTAGRRRCLIDIKQRALVTAHSPLNRLFLFICVDFLSLDVPLLRVVLSVIFTIVLSS